MRGFSVGLLLVMVIRGPISHSRAEDVRLLVVPSAHPAASSVRVNVDAGLVGEDIADSAISGHLVLDLSPSAVNPQTAQLTELALQIDDPVRFRLKRLLFVPAITASAPGGELKLHLIEVAEPEPIIGGQFDQFENLIGISGAVNTSVQPGPLDLSEQPPTSVDLENVKIRWDRQSVTVDTAIDATLAVPITAEGIDLEIQILIDGALTAQGLVPAAAYSWSVPEGTHSAAFRDVDHWSRNGVAGTESLPTNIDTVTFHAASATVSTSVDLEADQTVRQADFAGPGTLRLKNGRLEVETGQLSFASRLEIAPDAELRSQLPLLVTTTSDARSDQVLFVDGKSSPIALLSGTIQGTGSVETLAVGADAALRVEIGQSDSLRVTGGWDMKGELEIVPNEHPIEETTLLRYGTVDVDGIQDVSIGNQSLRRLEDGRFSGHWQDGTFYFVHFESQRAILKTSRATPGDTDGDGRIGFPDFLALSSTFGQPGDWPQGDFDGNGQVDFVDFLELSSRFGSTTAVSVPSPTSGWLLIVGLIVVATSRHRGWRPKNHCLSQLRGDAERMPPVSSEAA